MNQTQDGIYFFGELKGLLLKPFSLLEIGLSCVALGFPGGSGVKNPPANAGDKGDLGREDPLEEEMATHSSILAWKIQWTEEPDGYSPGGSQRVVGG